MNHAANMKEHIPSQIIRLNIGGKLFQTTKETLLSHGENFFSSLISGVIPSTKDETGAYFVDRNGRFFEPLLDYLRTGSLHIPKNMLRTSVLQEAAFYSIIVPELEIYLEGTDYCILEISATYRIHSKIFFRLYHRSIASKPQVVGEISTAGYWEVQKKQLLSNLLCIMGRVGWKLSHVLGTENDDGSSPESYVFECKFEGNGKDKFQELLKEINFDDSHHK